eukprot:366301-Chlamydomonas_euryale.AAC.10
MAKEPGTTAPGNSSGGAVAIGRTKARARKKVGGGSQGLRVLQQGRGRPSWSASVRLSLVKCGGTVDGGSSESHVQNHKEFKLSPRNLSKINHPVGPLSRCLGRSARLLQRQPLQLCPG